MEDIAALIGEGESNYETHLVGLWRLLCVWGSYGVAQFSDLAGIARRPRGLCYRHPAFFHKNKADQFQIDTLPETGWPASIALLS